MLTFRKLRFYRRLVTVASCVAPLRHCLIVILAIITHNLLQDIPKFSPSITKLCPDHSLPPLLCCAPASKNLRVFNGGIRGGSLLKHSCAKYGLKEIVMQKLEQGRTMEVTCQREKGTDGFVLQ